MKLSISGKDKYHTCPRSYELHYIHKIRPVAKSSALVFGSALDLALNELLLSKNLANSEFIFTEEWNKYKNDYTIKFFKNDLNIDLLSEQVCSELDSVKDESERNHSANWNSLLVKGILMLRAYNTELLPQFIEVLEVQKELLLHGHDEQGNITEDSVGGILDFKAKVKNKEGEIVIAVIDNKSTSKPYPKNSVLTKEQTALYSFIEDVEYAAFATIDKKTFKTQFIIDKVPKELQELTVQSFVDTVDMIKKGEFPKKEDRSKCWSFGSRCDYFDLCWNNKMEGLVKKE